MLDSTPLVGQSASGGAPKNGSRPASRQALDVQTADVVGVPLATLLGGVLAGVQRDLPGAVGTAVTIAHPAPRRGGGQLQVVAATGIGHVLPPITTGHLWGPSLLAAVGEEPLASTDMWHDPRWPHLAMDAVLTRLPAHDRDAVARVRGVAAVPGVWDETTADPGVVVLSAYLDGPAEQQDVAILARHEPLVASAITIAAVANRSTEKTDQVLAALASRAAIEQAKGAVLALRRCDADQAWKALRLTSQQCNVKLRELAQAFVAHIGNTPAEQSADIDQQVTVSQAARDAAALLWRALTEPALQTEQLADV